MTVRPSDLARTLVRREAEERLRAGVRRQALLEDLSRRVENEGEPLPGVDRLLDSFDRFLEQTMQSLEV